MSFWDTDFGTFIIIVAQCLAVTVSILVSLAFLLYMDRKVWAAVQLRRGPNVVGPWGLFQSFADFSKFVLKEIVIPAGADKIVFLLAPLLTFIFAAIAWVAIPFADGWVIADLNVGILYIFAISSLGVYGVIMGGWASNSKYPFLGGLRSAAQMVSYEVSIGLIIVGVLISTGSLNLTSIVKAQDGSYGLFSWYWLPHLPMMVIFFISALAETNRPPFDLPEAESELVAGYQVEYSSTPYLLFMIGEYMNIVLMCAMTTILFFGGWLSPIPGLPDGVFWFAAKVVFFFFLFAMAKAIVPRYRYDQLMRLGWKVFLPMSLAWVVIAAFLVKFDAPGYSRFEPVSPAAAATTAQACADKEASFREAVLADPETNAPFLSGFPPLKDKALKDVLADDGQLRVLVLQLYVATAQGLEFGQRAEVMGQGFLTLDPLVDCYAGNHDTFDAAGRSAYEAAAERITPERRAKLLKLAGEAVK